MGYLSDRWEDFKDEMSETWDAIKDGDIGELFEDAIEGSLNFVTGGLYGEAKRQIEGMYDLPPLPEQTFQDRKTSSRDAANTRRIVYGKTRVGGQLVYFEASGTDSEYIHMVFVVASHSCVLVEDVWFGDAQAFRYEGGTYVNISTDPDALIRVEHGKQAAANAEIVSLTPSGWNNNHKLLGQTYVYLRLKYSETAYPTGLPQITFTIKGKDDIYDPRTGTYGWTDNHALCVLDYLRWSRGFGIPDSQIDMTSFISAANIADEWVPSGPYTTERRYTVNGTIQFGAAPVDNVSSLLRAGAAKLIYSQGIWRISAGTYKAPVMAFDESDLVGGVTFQVGAGKGKRLNVAKGTYVSPDHDYEPVDFVQIAVDSYVVRDGEELVADLRMPFTNSGTAARRLGKIAIEQSRFGLGCDVTLKYPALDLAIDDRITLSIAGLGWVSKVFRIEDLEFSIQSGVRLVLQEDSPDIYDWTEGEALSVAVPPAVNLPNPYTISAPNGLAVTEELYATNIKSQIKTRAYFSWTPGGASTSAYDIEYRRNGGAWVTQGSRYAATSFRFDDLEPGSFEFRVRGINGIGVRSLWAQLNVEILGKTAPPPDVDLLFYQQGYLRWSYPSKPLDHAGFVVRYQNGDRQRWVDAIPLHEGLVTESRFNVSHLAGGAKTFLVKAVDTTGNESVGAAMIIQGVGDSLIENVILEYSFRNNGWTGTYTDCAIDGQNYIQADPEAGFYSPASNPFYDANPASLIFETLYRTMAYGFSYTPSSNELPSKFTVETTVNALSSTLEYISPDYPEAGYVEWPGSLDAEAKNYQFRLTVPSQTSGYAPEIREVLLKFDVPDVFETMEDVIISAAGTRLPIVLSYREIKAVTLTLQEDGSNAVSAKIIDKNAATGPLVKVFNAAGNAVTAIVDATVRGY